MTSWLGSTFAALGLAHYRVLWLGTLLAFLGFFMSTVVQSVVAFELAGTNRAVGWVVFGQGLAMFVLGPVGGAFADRLPKRRVIVVGQTLMTLVFFALAALVATGAVRVIHLSLGALVMGATFAFLGPARQAIVVGLVPESHRGNALVLNGVAHSMSRVLGPALAGVLLTIASVGAAGAYATMGILYAAAACSLVLVPHVPGRANASDTRVLGDLAEGLRYVRARPRLRLLILFFVAVVMFGYPFIAVLPGLVENAYGRSADTVSVLHIATAAGALTASLSVARFADSPHATTLYSAMAALFAVGLAATAHAPTFALAAVGMGVAGAGSGGFQALSNAVIARETDPVYIGRVLSLTLLAFGGFGLMGLPYGILADAVGERGAMGAMSACVGVVVVVLTLLLRRTR